MWPATAEREKGVQRISPAQALSVIMYYIPCISHPKQMSAPLGTGHVDSEVAAGACLLCARLGIAHLVKILSFISLLPDLGLQKHILSTKPKAVFVPRGCPSWNLLLVDTVRSSIETIIFFGILHCVYIF